MLHPRYFRHCTPDLAPGAGVVCLTVVFLQPQVQFIALWLQCYDVESKRKSESDFLGVVYMVSGNVSG